MFVCFLAATQRDAADIYVPFLKGLCQTCQSCRHGGCYITSLSFETTLIHFVTNSDYSCTTSMPLERGAVWLRCYLLRRATEAAKSPGNCLVHEETSLFA